jgi:hypothetical protein
METVHFKTVDPLSQQLLKSASRRGIRLNWDRYEKLQPQDGFLRAGLSCPYGCMQGPCRIDPFGRGPDRGLCGLDRDRMVAASLLRIVLNGTLENMTGAAATAKAGHAFSPSPLEKILSSAEKKLGAADAMLDEIARAAVCLSRPAQSADDLVVQALRLAVQPFAAPEKRPAGKRADRVASVKVGHGLLAQQGLVVGVCGKPSPAILEEVGKEAAGAAGGTRLVSLGEWVPAGGGFLPIVCTSGEAELVLTSGRIALLVAGPETDPSVVELCQSLAIPLIRTEDAGKTAKFIRQARQKAGAAVETASVAPVEETTVVMTAGQWEQSFAKKAAKRIAIVGGADYVQQSLGWVASEVGSALLADGHEVAAWGDAALWMIKKGLASPGRESAVRVLDSEQGPLLAVKALAAAGKLKQLKGICFSGVKGCRDLATALGLAALGVKVCVATPLPLWGSESVRSLLADKLGALGGSLAHFDHPAQAQEIVDWFAK